MVNKKIIKINEETHSRLSKQGLKGETFDDVIIKLLDFYEKKTK